MPFSEAEVRSLSAARSDVGWVSLGDMGIPPKIFQKILSHRADKLDEIERRSRANTKIVHTSYSKRQDESSGDEATEEEIAAVSDPNSPDYDPTSEFFDPEWENKRDRRQVGRHIADLLIQAIS